MAFQSQGADGGEWLGPDLKSVLERERAVGAERVVLAPIGFPAEHVETLYDLDVEAALVGLGFEQFVFVNQEQQDPIVNAAEDGVEKVDELMVRIQRLVIDDHDVVGGR